MTWQNLLRGDSPRWLLESDTPGVRYLARREKLVSPGTAAELRLDCANAHEKGPIAAVLGEMDRAGYWVQPGPGYNPKYRSTVWSVIMLAQLGASLTIDARIERACTYVLEHALTAAGQFSGSGSSSGNVDCLQGNLCWALLELGFDHPRLEQAFDWMARTVTGEGMAGPGERKATRRYYAAKCGPTFACGANNRLPCAWGGVKVLLALGKWPAERRTPMIERAIRQGVDFLLSVDPADAAYPTGYSSKPSQDWWKFGFPVFYVTDLLQLVEALAGLGHGSDPRLSRVLTLILEKQDPAGRWALDYDYAGKTWVDFGAKRQANEWVTLRALRAIKAMVSA